MGRYVFSQLAFVKAKELIRNSIGQGVWLIIDEIGPLELKNEGFADLLREVLQSVKIKQNILLVVREELLDKIKASFGVSDAIVVTRI